MSDLIHLNGNVLCAIDTETTGLTPGFHDLVEIAIIPLDANLKPKQDILPFNLILKPLRPENADVEALKKQKRTLAEIAAIGMDPWRAIDLFDNWFKQLKLAPGKKISPLAHNWPFDRSFIQEWLDRATFEQYIDGRYRDSMATSLFVNDFCDMNAKDCPYPKQSLGSLANRLGVELENAHTALEDALACAEVYRRLVSRFVP